MNWRVFRRSRIYLAIALLGTSILLFESFYKPRNVDDGKTLNSGQTLEGRRLFGSTGERDVTLEFKPLPADDPRVISRIKALLHPPSTNDYNLTSPRLEDFSRGQSKVIDDLLKGKENGFFLECGAGDGEKHSVSLYFERTRHWTGLLVEPDFDKFERLKHKHRKAYSIRACAQVSEQERYNATHGSSDVPCFWLESFITATERTTVDMLSLDLQGKEQQLLQTIPFQKLDIKVITVEFSNKNSDHFGVLKYLSENGYSAHHQFVNHVQQKTDLVFVKL